MKAIYNNGQNVTLRAPSNMKLVYRLDTAVPYVTDISFSLLDSRINGNNGRVKTMKCFVLDVIVVYFLLNDSNYYLLQKLILYFEI